MRRWTFSLAAFVLATAGFAAAAAPALTGTRSIVLSNAEGGREVIGSIAFTDAGGGKTAFAIELAPRFEEHFLAMRPFRCLTGPKQRLCWFPVRNEAPLISPQDLLPLEYALMFMRMKPTDLHLNPFNGVYYRLRWTEMGIRGQVHDLDMDPFITPTSVPPARRVRPVTAVQLEVADPRSHWLPELSIE